MQAHVWSILGPMSESCASIRYPHGICNTLCFTLSPSLCYIQDSSSGNTSDVESQEGGGGHGHKSKGKDRTSTPGKDGSHRHSASHKATPGYKVEDKTTWTLLQQQQQHFSTPSSSFYYYHSLTPSIPPPLLSFLHFVLRLIQCVSWDNWVYTHTHTHTHAHICSHMHTQTCTQWGSCLQFSF